MPKNSAERLDAVEFLHMPDQLFHAPFIDKMAPVVARSAIPYSARMILFGWPLVFSVMIISILVLAFRSDGQLTFPEIVLIAMMALLSGWEALSTANAIIGFKVPQIIGSRREAQSLTVAILVTLRDEAAKDVISGKLGLLRSLHHTSNHRFSLHVLSDSRSAARIARERQLVRAALPLPVSYHNRSENIDFKSGNIRNWVETQGWAFDAYIILDADSELDPATALTLADSLSSDPACGLIQTVPVVLPGSTCWQRMQSVASRLYGRLQGRGLSVWMGNEANYYGHNAIVRTKAFAACAGLPHLKGRGLWNGTILSHDFVEAALLRRAGWSVRLLQTETGSYEQAPSDVISYLKRDARWCLGNFQHTRILNASGLHAISRFHLLSGVFTYLSSVVWLATLFLWGALDVTQTGVGGMFATSAVVLVATNLLLPRVLGVIQAMAREPGLGRTMAKAALIETVFSSLVAPSLMVQRVLIIGQVLTNRRITWEPHEKASRGFPDYCIFHVVEVLVSFGLLACIERGFLTVWFLPLAVCFAMTPFLSWLSARPARSVSGMNVHTAKPLS